MMKENYVARESFGGQIVRDNPRPVWSICLIWFVLFIWLVSFNQKTRQTRQTKQTK